MPATVSPISTASLPSSQSYNSTSRASDSDRGSFGEALDRAQDKESRPTPAAGTDAAAATKPEARKTKSASPDKKATDATDTSDTKTKKKADPDQPTDTAGDQNGDSGSSGESKDDQGAKDQKPQRKVTAKVAADAASDPAAILQLQGGTPQPAAPQVASTKAAASDVAAGQSIAPVAVQPPDGSAKVAKPATAAATAASKQMTGDQAQTTVTAPPADPGADASATALPAKTGGDTQAASDPKQAAPNVPSAVQSAADEPVQPGDAKKPAAAAKANAVPAPGSNTPDATTQTSGEAAQLPAVDAAAAPSRRVSKTDDASNQQPVPAVDTSTGHIAGTTTKAAAAPTEAAPQSTDAQFAIANHARIISGIQEKLLPNGGSMHIRLDPPEMGAVNIKVEMRNGVMTASFEAANDDTARLLSHSLGDLKTSLEAQGVSVEKMHVTQMPKQASSSENGRKNEGDANSDGTSKQQQQRREMMQRMWRKLMKGQDPLDLVA